MKPVHVLGFVGAAALSAHAQAPLYGQCGGSNWSGATTCVSGATCVKSNEFYSQCVPSTDATTTTKVTSTTTAKPTTTTTKASSTTTKASSTTTKTSTTKTSSVTAAPGTTLPASQGYTAFATASTIAAGKVFDGGMAKFDRKGSSGECQGQTETGEADAVFIVESGGTVQNVIIGKDQAEGIHCRGPCTLKNVWWEDVCEDAATFEQSGASDVSYVIGGGAFHAEDKILQHNGAGTVSVSGFYANDFGKLYRACGNCATSHERHVIVDNVCLVSGSTGVGINTNWGDTAKLTNIKVGSKPTAANLCCTYKGVAKGSEPTKIGCGDSYAACEYSQASVGTCS